MAKKNTCKANKPVQKLKCYDIAFQNGDKVEHVEISVTHIEGDYATLQAFRGEEIVGEFREWMYYVRLDDEDDCDEVVTNGSWPEKPKLPKDWGKVNGEKF